MHDLMPKLEAYDWGGDRGALIAIEEHILAARGNTEKLNEIEDALVGVLQSGAKLPAKEYACRQLALMGTARCLPTLIEMLSSEELFDRALFALQAIPDGAVDDALRAKLDTASGNTRIGIVNTLGERRDQKSLAVLTDLRNTPDQALSRAVESAIRKIGAST